MASVAFTTKTILKCCNVMPAPCQNSESIILSKWINGSNRLSAQRLSLTHLILCCNLHRNSGISENDGTSLWNFVPNCELQSINQFYWQMGENNQWQRHKNKLRSCCL